MTREEAIKRIKDHKIVHKMNEPRAIYISEALDMGIKALEQQPSGDAISRQAVLNTLDYIDKTLDEDRTVEKYKEMLKECYEVLPSVTSQQTSTLDKIREEISEHADKLKDSLYGDVMRHCIEIIDEYIAESEE